MPKLLRALLVVVGTLIGIQVVPYGRAHQNPPITKEPLWDTAKTRELAKRACFDCHSHETVWPWYSSIAPVSWFVQLHVDDAREHLNFSMWDVPQKHAKDAAEEVEEGEMPLPPYLPFHSEAKLSDDDREALINGLKATLENGLPGA